MNNNYTEEVIVTAILLITVLFAVNPWHIWMPSMATMAIALAVMIVFVLFATMIWKERARDEREVVHRMIAARAGFLVGSGVLVLGIAVQSFAHSVNGWLVGALVAMVVAKAIGRIYSERKF